MIPLRFDNLKVFFNALRDGGLKSSMRECLKWYNICVEDFI